MNKTDDELKFEMKQHADKAIKSFRKGQEIHENYTHAPEKHNLIDEVEQFTAKLSEGISEMDKTIKLQDEYLDKNSNLSS